MAAAADSKSAVRKYVRVRVPPLAPVRANGNDWRGVRVVDGATLERLCGRKSTGGSNPPPSAKSLADARGKFQRIDDMRKVIAILIGLVPVAVLAATRFETVSLERSELPDTEASTNLVFDTGAVRDNRWTLAFEVDATSVNNAQIEFGIDADGDGVLSANECEMSVGWDCGEWVLRDRRSGTMRREADTTGRRRLEWTLHLTSDGLGRRLEGNVFSGGDVATLFNRVWDLARVVVRGTDAANEIVRSVVSVKPLVIRIR